MRSRSQKSKPLYKFSDQVRTVIMLAKLLTEARSNTESEMTELSDQKIAV